MKLSVSLPDDDVDYLDAYVRREGLASRSAGVQRAVQLLRSSGLGTAYAEAWAEWVDGGEAELWDPVGADGLP